ncbi:MAG: lysophospholipid acyltransferase family protein [Pseudomonadota bacterium]
MIKVLNCLYPLYRWTIFIPFLVVTTLIASLSGPVLCFFVSQGFASKWCGLLWGRLNVYATPASVEVFGRAHFDKNRSYVVVANHQSLFDILVIYGWMGIDLRWVMKKELRKIPFMGFCSEKLGHIIVDRADTQAALSAINAARKKITGGTSVIFFPEGTRSRNGRLGPFKKGAFRFALDLGLPILPVTITGTREILPPDSLNLMPGCAKMIFHPAIETVNYSADQLPELMALAKSAIQVSL